MRKIILIAATLSSTAFATDFGAALTSCLSEGSGYGVQKTRFNGSTRMVGSLDCYGDNARSLYDEAQIFRADSYSIDDRNQKLATRVFGPQGSQCNRIYETADGRPADDYYCTIFLDLMNDLVGNLNN